MLDWVITVLERGQKEHMTGRLHVDFRHGRVQHIERAAMPAPANTGVIKDIPEVLTSWLKNGKTGHVDIYLFQGTLVEVVESEVLFPPRQASEERCPRCNGKLGPPWSDYGQKRKCVTCDTVWDQHDLDSRGRKEVREMRSDQSTARRPRSS